MLLNKKVRVNLVAILICIFPYHLSYAKENTINGNARLYDITFESLRINGSLKFRNLSVKEKLYVNGSAVGKKLKCKRLKINGSFNGINIEATEGSVNGSLKGSNITIPEKVKISGKMLATNSNFGDIEIKGNEIKLTNSKTKNILVKKTGITPQKLELKKKSIVSGNVVFEAGNGQIYLSGGSKIQGIVKGATIVKK